MARRFSKIIVKSFKASAEARWSDPVEVHRLGKLALQVIEFRRLLLEKRRGPKWTEERELRRMERQVWRGSSGIQKRPKNGRSELTRMSKELKQIMDRYRTSKATVSH